jgi:serine/threonine protein kinase
MIATVVNWIGRSLSGNRYQVKARLPAGGMSEVYRAWDKNLQTEVVIKVPHRSLFRDSTFAARFSREIQSLVRLAHPHVVRVIDVGDHEGLPFAVLQYLAGGSLYDRMIGGGNGRRPLPAASLAGWLLGVAEALDFIHGQNYVHRDVKPGNILFDGHGHVFLSDFGIAKALADTDRANLTQRGMVPGTLQYVAPEIFRGKPADGRADQYALAVTVYEVLTGRWPFEGTDDIGLVTQHKQLTPPALHQLVPGIPEAVTQAVGRGLARDPDQRFSNCRSFARAVLEALTTPPFPGIELYPPLPRQQRQFAAYLGSAEWRFAGSLPALPGSDGFAGRLPRRESPMPRLSGGVERVAEFDAADAHGSEIGAAAIPGPAPGSRHRRCPIDEDSGGVARRGGGGGVDLRSEPAPDRRAAT